VKSERRAEAAPSDDIRPSPAEQSDAAGAPAVFAEPSLCTVRQKSLVREYAEPLSLRCFCFCDRVFVVQAFKIPSGSMIPLVDRIISWSASSRMVFNGPASANFQRVFSRQLLCFAALIEFGKPQREISSCSGFQKTRKGLHQTDRWTPVIQSNFATKRVVNGSCSRINPSPTDRSGIIDGTINPRDNFGPVTVPDGAYFVMVTIATKVWTAGSGFVREEKIRGSIPYLLVVEWSGQMTSG